jgi:hypothetical protein
MNKLNTMIIALGLLTSFSSTFAMEKPVLNNGVTSEKKENQTLIYPVVKGELYLADCIEYQCGLCVNDEKNSSRYHVSFKQNDDPLVSLEFRLSHDLNGFFQVKLPYSLLANKKENDLIRLFDSKTNSIFELVCKASSFMIPSPLTNPIFEVRLETMKQHFLRCAYPRFTCEKALEKLKIVAKRESAKEAIVDTNPFVFAHGIYGFGKVPNSLKDTCIKYIFFNKHKLSAAQCEQIKLLPEELREQVEPSTKDEQKQ